jgi:hypothetical protein
VARRPVRHQRLDRFARAAAGGTSRAFAFLADPGLLRLDLRWWGAARQFFGSGFWYFLDDGDHLLVCSAWCFLSGGRGNLLSS